MSAPNSAMSEGHEQVLLAAMMNGTDELPVSAEDFSSSPNRVIFNRIVGMTNRSLLAVTDALQQSGELESVGGAYRITEISQMPHDSESVLYAIDCVLEDARERRAAAIGAQLHKGELTIEQAQEQLAQLKRPQHDLPPIEDAAELVAKPIVLPDDVIAGVLHRGGKGVASGATKTFKTWLWIDTAVSVATGTDWLGKFQTKRGRVLYINLEIQPAFFARRIQTICAERQIEIETGFLRVWNLRGYAADLSKLLPRLLRGIACDEYVLIIIDPVYKLLGARDENRAGDIASLLNEIEALAVATGAAVAFGAHYSKGNQAQKESIDRIGGSGVFARDPDTILNFTRHEQADCFTVEATLRNHPPIEPFVVRWEFPLFVVDSLLDPEQLKQAGKSKSKGEPKTKEDVLALVPEDGSIPKNLILVKAQRREIGLNTARAFLNELLEDGQVFEHERERKGTRPEIRISRHEPHETHA